MNGHYLLPLLAVLGGSPVLAQQVIVPDPFELISEVGALHSAEGPEGVFRRLDQAVRQARGAGALTPDWAVVFMMLADSIRNTRENAPYALRIAEEGLDLARAGSLQDRDIAPLLEVSRAYALADLGRFAEAAEAAILALPMMRESFGQDDANELEGYARQWAKGELGAFNLSVLDIATREVGKAETLLDQGDYGRALTLAARGFLPEVPGLNDHDWRWINARAGLVTGNALFQMNRPADAQQALEAAVTLIVRPGWQHGGAPDWIVPPVRDPARVADLFFWLGRSWEEVGALDAAVKALTLANDLDPDPREKIAVKFALVNLLARLGHGADAIEILEQQAVKAEQLGDQNRAVLARFYVQMMRASVAETLELIDRPALIAATEDAIAVATTAQGAPFTADFVQAEAAAIMAESADNARALAYARAAFAARLVRIDTEGGTAIGERSARTGMRALTKTLLKAAIIEDGALPGASCSDEVARGCVRIVDLP